MQQRYLCMCYPGASEVKKKVLKLECEDKVKTQQQQNVQAAFLTNLICIWEGASIFVFLECFPWQYK